MNRNKLIAAVMMLALLAPAVSFGAVAKKVAKKPVVKPVAKVKVVAPPRVTAQAWVVADAKTGAVVASYRPDAQRSIASLTKLTTVKVATRDLKLDLNQVVAMASEDEVGGGRLRMNVGTPVLARDLVAAALAGSANNAANAIARATGLTRAQFVTHMNASAAAMGLKQTHFVEPTGIEAGNVSTAREVLKMSLDAFHNDLVLSMTSAPHYTIAVVDSADVHNINNTNALVRDAAVDVVAGKTGFTYEAGYALTTRLAKSGKSDLIVVVLGSSTKNRSFSEAKALAQWAWKYKSLSQ
jgi:D-alanyl-D-alanine endopeptidase (penicillin-binding protein 7)